MKISEFSLMKILARRLEKKCCQIKIIENQISLSIYPRKTLLFFLVTPLYFSLKRKSLDNYLDVLVS